MIQGKDMDEKVDATLDRLLVEFGKEILKIVPGKVSTEVDARFSFDVQGSINKALHIIEVRWKLSSLCTFASLIFYSSTKTKALARSESSSSSLRLGKASKRPRSCRRSTVSIAI